MKNLYTFLSVLFISLLCLTKAMAQFTGGNGCGYTSAVSVVQQLNPLIYNDIQLGYITQPIDNQILNINTNYNLDFNIENPGTYPVFPDDSIFFTVTLNTDLLIDSFFFLTPDTLQPGASTNKLFANILNFSDSSAAAQLCITLNGTSFALDSVISNNTHCNTVNIIDPSGIESNEKDKIIAFFNHENKCIVLKNAAGVKKICTYDIIGNEILTKSFNTKNSEILINLNVKNPTIIFLKIYSENMIFTKKLLIF